MNKPEKVLKINLQREQGWFYYTDDNCNIVWTIVPFNGTFPRIQQTVLITGVKREPRVC